MSDGAFSGNSFSGDVWDHVSAALRSPGQPIEDECRAWFERAFGRDLSHVLIHTGSEARRSASLLGARAYTVGNHVVFAEDNYDPFDPAGRQLLAHELVHVVQQYDAAPVRRAPLALGGEDDFYEQQARRIGELPLWREKSGAAPAMELPPVLARRSAALYKAVSKSCVAPSEALTTILDPVGTRLASSIFGLLAEGLIGLDYLSKRPGKIFVDHYFDNPITSSYIAFLAFHNRRLRTPANLALLAILSNMKDAGIERPDILTDQPGIQELYEIKPDSFSGKADGVLKLLGIDAFMGIFKLPYKRGSTYAPTPSLPIASGTIPTIAGPVPYKATLEAKRTMAGLIQYKICVETDFLKVGATALVLIAVIIVVIITRRLPGRLPPFPIPIPMPTLAP
jgi:hypothetical protein